MRKDFQGPMAQLVVTVRGAPGIEVKVVTVSDPRNGVGDRVACYVASASHAAYLTQVMADVGYRGAFTLACGNVSEQPRRRPHNPDTVEIARLMRRQGKTLRAISEELAASGHTSSTGKAYGISAVHAWVADISKGVPHAATPEPTPPAWSDDDPGF